MKKTFRIKCFKLVLGVSLCFLIYLLVSLIIPPLIGTHEKSDTQAEVSITTSERVCLIDNNEDALLWRLRLIRSAQEEIILSTFDFRADSCGTDVIAALWGAAERGVQVRLIIDGINAQLHLSGSDVFQALAAHDNVEVKFYNPIRLTQLWTVNYRCHDKYLIIDRFTYLMGGRNAHRAGPRFRQAVSARQPRDRREARGRYPPRLPQAHEQPVQDRRPRCGPRRGRVRRRF